MVLERLDSNLLVPLGFRFPSLNLSGPTDNLRTSQALLYSAGLYAVHRTATRWRAAPAAEQERG